MSADLDLEINLYKAISSEGIAELTRHYGVSTNEIVTRMVRMGVKHGEESILADDWDKLQLQRQGKFWGCAIFGVFGVLGALVLLGLFAIFTKEPEDNFCVDDKFPCTTLKDLQDRR